MKKHILIAAMALGCKQNDATPTKVDPNTPAPATPAAAPAPAPARDYISIVGSSTVYPFSTVVAEQFGKTSQFKSPKVESTGSGGGLKLFCEGVGAQHPDVANASRRIKPSEVENCAKNGVKDIVEIKIGYDGIVLASSKAAKPMSVTLPQLWRALAKQQPGKEPGKLVPNPNVKWSDIDPKLPATKIEVLGPPPTSGTRDAFVELALDAGCDSVDWIKALAKTDEKQHKAICQALREDGAFIEAGENDNLIVQKLGANPNAFGIFGFSYLDQNAEKLQGAAVSGVQPTFESISKGTYPLSRPLFMYVKKAHVGVIPGIAEYVAEFTSPKAWGPDGYLAPKGMIPMSDAERAQVKQTATALEPMKL
ncbi:MAG TPA: PstS family phosphate ABC transporter substrate-binding protein [Polyangiaceae bacterium]|nr:PstS family phosphate ABC transporter substrate-binding protein [Polyangiaceae bacterium]